MNRILEASIELLAEHGVEKLTTRRIAARAGVNVSTLYQFFPNKHAIVYALYEDWLNKAKMVFQETDKTLHTSPDWRAFFSDLMQRLSAVDFSAEIKTSLKQAMTVYEDLRALDKEYTNWAVGKIGVYIEHFGPVCSVECKSSLAILLLERDHTLAIHELHHGQAVTAYLSELTRNALLHLLEECIEHGKVCGPTCCN